MCGLRDEGTYYCTALVKGSCGLKVCGGMGGSREANRSMTEPKKKKNTKKLLFEGRVEQRFIRAPQDG